MHIIKLLIFLKKKILLSIFQTLIREKIVKKLKFVFGLFCLISLITCFTFICHGIEVNGRLSSQSFTVDRGDKLYVSVKYSTWSTYIFSCKITKNGTTVKSTTGGAQTSYVSMDISALSNGTYDLTVSFFAQKQEFYNGQYIVTDYTGTIEKTCTLTVIHTHSYGSWQKLSETHCQRVCKCGVSQHQGHIWDTGTLTLSPTLHTTGTKTYTCTDCNYTRTETTPQLCEYKEWQKYTENQHKRTCNCDEIVEYANHNWNGGVITTPATHLTLGVKSFTCIDCGETKTEDVAKLTAHEYGTWISRVEPGCTNTGALGHYHCICGLDFDENYQALASLVIPALGHYIIQPGTTLVDSITTTNDSTYPYASSLQNGETVWRSTNKANNSTSIFTIRALYDCTLVLQYSVSSESGYDKLIILKNSSTLDTISGSVSWKTKTITLSAGDVVYIKYTKDGSQYNGSDEGYFIISSCTQSTVIALVKTPIDEITPTCTEGVVCSDCSQEIKGALGHDAVPHAAQAASCTEIGWDAYETCSRCDYSTYVEIPIAGHTYGEWQKHSEAQHKRVCACSQAKYGSHAWDNGVITKEQTSCDVSGEKTYTCNDCGETRIEYMLYTVEHTYGDWKVVREATESSYGREERYCTVCGHTDSQTTPKGAAYSVSNKNSNKSNKEKTDNLDGSNGAVVAIVCGSTVAVGGGGVALWWFVFRKKKHI